ncbi:18709_t:CDS:2, partial [Racocetra fulgida]
IKWSDKKLEGSTGKVVLGEYKGKKVAGISHVLFDDKIIQELRKHKNLRSEYIIEFCGVVKSPNDRTYLVTKFAEKGSLRDFLEKNEHDWNIKAKMAVDIANGLIECHKNGIVHSDLKADNILVNKHLTLKIAGFDLGITKEETGEALLWRAPECFADYKPFKDQYASKPEFSKIFNESLALFYKDQPQLSVKMREDINDLEEILELKDAPGIIKHVIKKCCEFNPTER